MPCSATIHKDRRLVVTTAPEVFPFAEGIAHEDQLYRDPDFDPTYAHLIDATRVTETMLTSSELGSLARRTKFSPKSRRALVATSPVVFGLAECLRLICNSPEWRSRWASSKKWTRRWGLAPPVLCKDRAAADTALCCKSLDSPIFPPKYIPAARGAFQEA